MGIISGQWPPAQSLSVTSGHCCLVDTLRMAAIIAQMTRRSVGQMKYEVLGSRITNYHCLDNVYKKDAT